MLVEVHPASFGAGRQVLMSAGLVIVRQDNGTIAGVAGKYGPDGAVCFSVIGDPGFQQLLYDLGIRETVTCDIVTMPQPPQGARLIAAPR